MSISRSFPLAATVVLGAIAGCAHPANPPVTAPAEKPVITQVLPLDQLYILEMGGVAPEDTTVTFAKGARRVIIIRHGTPDNTTFAELIFPATTFAGNNTPDSITVTVRIRPGVYGLDLTMPAQPGPGALIRFKYPIHFAAPNEALSEYGGRAPLERALVIATRQESGSYGLLVSDRPASDNLQAPLGGSGTYLVVAPR